ncbi:MULTISPECIES: SsgA family sporulation/cell division regulator [Streptomyces]|uniref:SsgA family sporulation/cell division regulator n=1 Tax=Streptomyces thermoviolaceus subsp. thermoviolaceus TaxID=66860 RepID=A0ABX0YU60_STRTL|nr:MULTISPECIES: SsgA family sporulation/cell division regulator [Streptomyces]MCM3264694.1 SsgA family sporulation/cell division regulator [Streptomyces thermoviolaceus]NJP15547.1 SsgA family sporulation/cell division regulator [Streptomyces thermoviolaceus subsp. thermoviolaceus]RSS05085.1 SsgA family sporulation/cell division regulator [Streptomyces sp. WAC00469]WTD48839.1 SsgA family sporulation/cell division regulator [Streptomyces thermoviolaceus]GGV68895.1 cell division protein [Strepto
MPAVEQFARARVVTDDDSQGERDAVPVVLHYEPHHDPEAVRIVLPDARVRVFPRSLLEQGLRRPAGTGEVRVWPCGRVQTVLEFHSARGVSVVQIETKTLVDFLRRTYTEAMATAFAHG